MSDLPLPKGTMVYDYGFEDDYEHADPGWAFIVREHAAVAHTYELEFLTYNSFGEPDLDYREDVPRSRLWVPTVPERFKPAYYEYVGDGPNKHGTIMWMDRDPDSPKYKRRDDIL